MATANLNERAVLDFILRRPETTVQQVADHLDLSASTVANVCARLLDKQLVVRGPSVAEGRGRPAATYRAALPGDVAVVSFDGSRVSAALFDDNAEPLATHHTDLVRVDKMEDAVNVVDDMAARILSIAHRNRRDLHVLVITLNALRSSRGKVSSSSVLPWVNDKLPAALRRRLGIDVQIVPGGILMAEFEHIDDPDIETMVRFNVGDGVSSHAMILGRAAAGLNGLAGELGHITLDAQGPRCGCGKRGCVEAMVSGPAIRNTLRAAVDETKTKTSLDPTTLAGRSVRLAIDHIWQCWSDGDKLARRAMDDVLDQLAWAMSISLTLFDPDLVRIDGYVLRDRQAWIDELIRRVRPQLLRGSSRKIIIEPARATVLDQQRIAAYYALADRPGRHPSLKANRS